MKTELTRRPANELADEFDTDAFPYGPDRTGYLPTATARGVLRSQEPAGPIGRAGSTACPSCGSESIDGAGLFACIDCDWTGTLR